MEDIVSGRSGGVPIARMWPYYADVSLNVTTELKEAFNNLKSQGELDMERIKAAVNTIAPRSPFFALCTPKIPTVTNIKQNAVECLRQ